MSKQIYKYFCKFLLNVPAVFVFACVWTVPAIVIITSAVYLIAVVSVTIFARKIGVAVVIGIDILRICIIISVVILRIVLIIICVALVIVVSVRISVLSVKIIWIYSAVRIIICVVTVVRLRSVIVWELCIGINICLILFIILQTST